MSSLNDLFSIDVSKYNALLGLVVNKTVYFTVDTMPDYDYSAYDSYRESDYYFANSWDFSFDFSRIFRITNKETLFVHPDLYHNLNKFHKDVLSTNGFKSNSDVGDMLSFVIDSVEMTDEVHKTLNENLLNFDSSMTPHINVLNIAGVDNNKKKVFYNGSFYSAGIDHGEYDVVCCAEVIGVGVSRYSYFFKELLVEAYSHLVDSNYKMAYFIAYSALENYVNWKINGDLIEERFSNKYKSAFKTLPEFEHNIIYPYFKSKLPEYTTLRIVIAHGKDDESALVSIDENKALDMYLFTVITILTIEKQVKTPQDLINLLN